MKDKIEQFFHKTKTFNLSSKEKEAIRARLLLEMQSRRQQENSKNFFAWRIFLSRHSVGVALVAILFFTGATTTFAEKSFPDSVFFPIKIHINEKVLGLFATSPQSYAELQIKLAERRLDEVLYLEAESANAETRQVARQRLEEQTKNAEMGVESFVAYDVSEIDVSLATEEAPEETQEITSGRALMNATRSEVSQSPVSRTTFDRDELIEKIRISRDKIHDLRKIIYQKNDLSSLKKLRLKKEIFLTEKALFEIREKLNSDEGSWNGADLRDVEERVYKIETSANEDNRDSLRLEIIEGDQQLPKADVPTLPEVKGVSSPLNTTIIDTKMGKEIDDETDDKRGR